MGLHHVNLLKKWETPSTECYTAEEVEEEEEHLPDWKDKTLVQPIVRSQLTPQVKEDVYVIFKEFSDILQICPGLTN